MQVAWKPVPFLSVLQICVTNARAGFIAICSISYSFSVLFTGMQTLKFSSQICDKKNHQIFKTCISWGFRALFVKKLFKLFFRFRLVKLSGWGGVGGGDDNVPWTCTHVWCYANWFLRDVNIPWTCTHVWCYANVHTCLNYANWFLRDVNIPWTCTHVWCYANWFLRDVNIPWTCTHVWCYANWFLWDVNIWQNIKDWVPNSLCAQRSGKVNSSLMTYCRQWQWRNAHVLCKDLMATTGKALKRWPNLQLGLKNRTGFQSAGMYIHFNSLSQWTLKKKRLNFIFPTKYVIPKSLKFSHWLSELIGNSSIFYAL